MRRIGTVLVVVLTVLAGVAIPVVGMGTASTADVGGATTAGQTETADANNGTAAAAPGTRLAGSVGVQGAELGGELETRSFNHQFNGSDSNASKAQVVARQANQSRDRLAALRAEREQLERARENGTISENAYRVRAAQLSARTTALRQVTDRTAQRARTLPAETLRRNGVNVTALETLRTEADELTGPEVAAIARTLAGPGATRGSGFGPPENAGRDAPGPSGPPADSPGPSENASGNDSNQPPGQEREQGQGAAGTAHPGNETSTGPGGQNGTAGESGRNPDGGNDPGNAGGNSGENGNDNAGGNNDENAGGNSGENPGNNGSANATDPERSGSRSGGN